MDLDETMTTSTTSTPSPSAFQDTGDIDVDESFDDDTPNNLLPDNPAGPTNGQHQHNHPRTPPPANDHLNAAAPGELSPPRSQPNSQSSGTDGGPTTNLLNGGRANTSAARTTRQSTQMAGTHREDANGGGGGGGIQSDQTEQDERPGWGWKNKKAQEDMQRAWDSIVDRDFSLKEYGDVVMQGKAQLGQ
ncbi:hypothetical protein HRR83_006733 [Exophiala dermatitidis]|uniref:Uncharacterized protein n=2 Tax=Exophiala dermatitidis TaxID=5970 RepID=H6BVF2_EXODN|nr:uncharacterized protein HMPREF1120_03996 [Exophiala dermatitidis NIH/UT8656]KAJ4511472.1 hypothetical protein HRR75_005398 [Exophiala dermatitidis]EHY55882.1 hypothetical protein HMPREF1120_03996 [Exophiala dermatitidis NIH/UT8656]KAJ4514234.1 hypothetical protein HRR74_005893 [Exophiala dermatitidis]KAJ4515282.1 hypothetical protein HRR73_005113 [Exophiala dermatitidis]KAJ4535313.1 hypothetical protein HRR77_007931 [Exophiala dermatitidis]